MTTDEAVERLEAERAFLLARAEASHREFTSERWTGISSDALVAYAFGQAEPDCNYMGGKPGKPAGRRSGWICSGWLGHPGPHHSGADELVDAFPSDPLGYPHDPSDLLACERTWLRLPEHLKTAKVRAAPGALPGGCREELPQRQRTGSGLSRHGSPAARETRMRAYCAEFRRFLSSLAHVRYVGRVVGIRNVVRCEACRGWHHRAYHDHHPSRP